MRLAVLASVVGALVLLGACSGSDVTSDPGVDPNTTADTGGGPKEDRTSGAAPSKFTGQDEENYEIAFEVCGVFGLKKTARDLGVAADPVTVAEAYAEGFQPAFQQAPFEGCLDALLLGEA